MRRWIVLFLMGSLALLVPMLATAAERIGAEEARAIGIDAYVYLYPLVTMDVTRKQFTNIEPGKAIGRGPMNTVSNVAAYPSADFRAVVRPNFDTLYSTMWLDLTQGPVILSVPDTGGRYYLMPMLDMWTDVFASPGWRTTGTAAADYAVVPPGWTGELPEGVRPIQAPTPYVWIIGRTKTDGPADYAAVHALQAGYKLTPLAGWGRPAVPEPVGIDPTVDMTTPPKIQVDTMPAGRFFAYAAELLKLHPPHPTDQPILARMARLGFEAGRSFDLAAAEPVVAAALEGVPAAALKLMAWKVPTLAKVVNGWSMNVDTMGVYGNAYLKRAIVAQLGLGANVPEDAIYPLNLVADDGRPLDGANRYTLRFEPGQLPPVDAFWSLTLYDGQGFQVANPLDRFALSSWMPLEQGADGSLELHVQHEDPGPARQANWLPAPAGPFNVMLRLYAPRAEVLTGRWNPPPIAKVHELPGLLAQ